MAKRKALKTASDNKSGLKYIVGKKLGTLGIINNYKDQFVSINLKKATYFGLGENEDQSKKLWLSPENYFDLVPDNLTNEEVEALGVAISDDKVVLGKVWLPPVDKDKKVIKKYLSMLSEATVLTEEFKEKIVSLFRYKEEGHYTALEIFKAMLDKEKKTRDRPTFVAYLNDAIGAYIGPVQLVQDYPDDPDNYSVVIDDGVIVSTDRKEKPKADALEFKGFDNPERRSEVITKALG